LSTDAIAGRATHYVPGGPQGLDEGVYVDLRRSGVIAAAAPVIGEYVSSPQLGEVPLQLLGVDPFAEAPFRDYLSAADGVPLDQLTAFLTQPGAVLVSTGLAARYDLALGEQITLEVGGYQQLVTIAGLLEPTDELSQRALDGMLLADIATAQELTRRLGVIDRIDLILSEGDEATLEAVQVALPKGTPVLPVAGRSGAVEQMTAAFRTNLTALSLLALVVGVFLIYNTMTFSVVQRRPLFGTLRCLGVTRAEIFTLVEVEALLVGVLGTALGIGLGVLMGQGAVRLVSRTINDLFFTVTVQDVALPVSSLLKGATLGVLGTLAAAAAPAWEAASIPPRAALTRSGLESKAQQVVRWAALGGLGLVVVGIGLLAIPTRNLVISFAGTFGVVIGLAALTPLVTEYLMRAATQITGRLWGALGRMAPRQVVAAISRTAIAVAALMVAVSVTIGVSLMVGSFRHTVITWMEQILSGDVYVSVPGTDVTDPSIAVDPEVVARVEQWPGVLHADLLRSAVVDSTQGPVTVNANNNDHDWAEQVYIEAIGAPEDVWAALQAGAITISEPLANRLYLSGTGGDVLTLYTDDGPVDFPIAAVYADYASVQGSAIMWLDVYRAHWDDDAITAISLRLEPGVDIDQTVTDLQATLTPIQSLLIRPNQVLRQATLEIFDRTFAITGALQIMTTVVAFVGVVSAMLSLQLEKQRQFGILKAVGLTGRQLWLLVLLETGLMGGVAGLLAMPTGYVLSLILVYIINLRSFGWTLQMNITPGPFLQALAVAVLAALLAGIYPAYRSSKRLAADAIRFD
ncbi:MAG: ABC transporter permease, partial [Anaerolineales bacterium]|nr:ABC transporter permease [Anaerolineales bacterium]